MDKYYHGGLWIHPQGLSKYMVVFESAKSGMSSNQDHDCHAEMFYTSAWKERSAEGLKKAQGRTSLLGKLQMSQKD